MKDIMIKENVYSENLVQLPSTNVWEKLVSFGGTEKFVPDIIQEVVVEGKGIGAIRIIKLKGGGEIIEKLTEKDETNRFLKFEILYTPMPVQNYVGTLKVTPDKEGTCQVYFESVYDVSEEKKDEMNKIIKGFQETFISNLHK